MSKHVLQGWMVFLISSLGGYWLYQQTSSIESITFLTELTMQSAIVMYAIFLPLFFFQLSSLYAWFAKLVVACYSCFHAYLGPGILEQHGMVAYSFDFGFYISQFLVLWCAIHSTGKGWIILYLSLASLHLFMIY